MFLSVFDIFKIGIGPSSSHTMGPMAAAGRFLDSLAERQLPDGTLSLGCRLYGSLAYTGEGHGLSGLANRKDLTVRYFEFFNHYLKDAPAPKWMTEGVAYLDKGKEK